MKTVICLLAVVAFAAGAQMVDPFGKKKKSQNFLEKIK